jgi:hypothetical protein
MEQEKVLTFPVELRNLYQVAVFSVIFITSFSVPFLMGHPQWLVGTVVNAGLFLAATYLPKKYFLPIVIFPSLAVLARGLIFGQFTWFLIYFLPFVWLSNYILVQIFSFLANRNKGYIISVVLAAAGKFALLFLIANIYFKFSVVPAVFFHTMGLNQLATALAGGLISFLIYKFYGAKFKQGGSRAS